MSNMSAILASPMKSSVAESFISYAFFQFKTLCQTMDLELKQLKSSLLGKSSYPYLTKVVQLQRDAKLMLKKVTMNVINKDMFEKLMIEGGFIDKDLVDKQEYLLDLLFVNILDQIFLQTVIIPNMADIQACLHHEL